jgi:hypothetical protein
MLSIQTDNTLLSPTKSRSPWLLSWVAVGVLTISSLVGNAILYNTLGVQTDDLDAVCTHFTQRYGRSKTVEPK